MVLRTSRLLYFDEPQVYPPLISPALPDWSVTGVPVKHRADLSPILIPMFLVLVIIAFLVVGYFTFARKYYLSSDNHRRMRRANTRNVSSDHRGDFEDGNHGPAVDHPVWLIITAGLEPSAIESIPVFKYRSIEGLTQGTECSICLSDFERNESLRLLPRCSHHFHVPCIDTWLRSHTNCPTCRAPVVSESTGVASELDPNLSGLRRVQEARGQSLGDLSVLGGHLEGSEMGTISENFGVPDGIAANKNPRCLDTEDCKFRVLSDLGGFREKNDGGSEPAIRSISMDTHSASRICGAVVGVHEMNVEGCSSSQLVQAKNENPENPDKRASVNARMPRLKKSSSLRMGPVSMKRSVSLGGKLF